MSAIAKISIVTKVPPYIYFFSVGLAWELPDILNKITPMQIIKHIHIFYTPIFDYYLLIKLFPYYSLLFVFTPENKLPTITTDSNDKLLTTKSVV